MKAISLWQPWASAMALGWKRIETRAWYTIHRGPLLIHAAKQRNDEWARLFNLDPNDLPYGRIICKVNLVDCRRITEENLPDSDEYRFGDYTPGRFMWMTTNLEALRKPMPFIGRQGLFNVPEEMLK